MGLGVWGGGLQPTSSYYWPLKSPLWPDAALWCGPWFLVRHPLPSAQLPEGSSAIQMTEHFLSSLNSVIATWLSSSLAPWVTDTIFAILCGVGLFLLLLPFLENKPSSSPHRKYRKIKKVRNPWPRANKNYLYFYSYFPISESPRKTPEMRILGNYKTSSS